MDKDTAREVLKELDQVPAFRGQRLAAENQGIDVIAEVTKSLTQVNSILLKMGEMYFIKHPDLDRAPYGVFLEFNARTSMHDVKVRVGNASLTAAKEISSFILMQGELGKVLIDDKPDAGT